MEVDTERMRLGMFLLNLRGFWPCVSIRQAPGKPRQGITRYWEAANSDLLTPDIQKGRLADRRLHICRINQITQHHECQIFGPRNRPLRYNPPARNSWIPPRKLADPTAKTRGSHRIEIHDPSHESNLESLEALSYGYSSAGPGQN